MRKTNQARMQVPPLSYSMHRPSTVRGMTTVRPTSTVGLIHIRGVRALTLSLYTGRRLTSVSCQFINVLNCFCVEFIRVSGSEDVAPNYLDHVGKKHIRPTPIHYALFNS